MSRFTAKIIVGTEWIDIPFQELKKGHLFRLFEPDGTIHETNEATTFRASSDAYYNAEEKDWRIEIYTPDKERD